MIAALVLVTNVGYLYAQSSGVALEGEHIKIKALTGKDTLIIYRSADTTIMKSLGVRKMGINPHTATMFAAVVPGLGQIYNKKYWKVPIVYGGIAALCYSIHFNSKYYDIYRRGYRDLINKDPNNTSYMKIIEDNHLDPELCLERYADWFQRVLENKKNYYRRYRDLSYFGIIGVYVLQLVDACVDAHFHDFDVTDDLAMRWSPMILPDDGGPLVGATVCINF